MKKFLTVLLVIAVMFTFSFSGAFAAGSKYSYAGALQEIEKSANDYLAAAKALYETEAVKASTTKITHSVTALDVTISKTARNAVYADAYAELEKDIANYVSQAKTAFDANLTAEEKANDEIDYSKISPYLLGTYAATINGTSVQYNTAWALPAATDDAAKNNFAKAYFNELKADALKGLAAIDLTKYDDVTKFAVDPFKDKTSKEAAKKIIADAINVVESYKYIDSYVSGSPVADALDKDLQMIQNLKAIYVPAEGVDDPTGLIFSVAYNNTDADKLYQVDAKVNADNKTVKFVGLQGLTKTDITADAKLTFAKGNILSHATGLLATQKTAAVSTITGKIITEQAKGAKADAKKIAELQDALNNVNTDFTKAVEVITYLVNNAKALPEITNDAYNSVASAGWTVSAFSDDTGKTDDIDFGNVTVTFPTGAKLATTSKAYAYVSGTAAPLKASVSDLAKIAGWVADAKEKAADYKAQNLIDGTTYTDIDADLEDAIDDIYRGKASEFITLTTTDSRDYVFHYVEDKLMGTAGKKVTISEKKYENINSWYANAAAAGKYDAVKAKEVKAIAKETEAAVKAAATVADADAAFLAGYEKYDAVMTADEHREDFLYSTGANHAKYESVRKELEAYVEAKASYLAKMGIAKDYPSILTGTFANDYTKADGYFYTKCFTAEDLDAMLAKAKAEVDGLKSEKVLAEEGAAIVKEVPTITKATAADKDAVMTVYDKYKAHNDYCAQMGSTQRVYNYKIESLSKEVEADEATAIDDAYKAIMKDGKVVLDEKAAVQALRKAFDEYQAYWVDADKYTEITKTLKATENQIATLEKTIDNLEADALIKAINDAPATGATAEQIKALVDGYQALSRTAKDKVYHDTKAWSKFVDLQKLYAEENSVETLKLTAKSKAKKGSITVTWTVKGEADIDGFQVWKSTKQSKGYKKAFTTKKTSYKNTKGLKKGTRYYYKVRAYKVVDGKNVYSDWSNKAYRKAK